MKHIVWHAINFESNSDSFWKIRALFVAFKCVVLIFPGFIIFGVQR